MLSGQWNALESKGIKVKPDSLSLVAETHTVEGENWILQDDL